MNQLRIVHSSHGDRIQCGFDVTICLLIFIGMSILTGCQKAPPPPIDPAKTPWLDPASQMENLEAGDFRLRGLAAFHLGNIGAPAVEAISALEKIADDDPHPKVRENARAAVEKIRKAIGKAG